MVFLSSIPDIDLELRKKYGTRIKHREITHTLLAGVLFGIVFGALLDMVTVFWIGLWAFSVDLDVLLAICLETYFLMKVLNHSVHSQIEQLFVNLGPVTKLLIEQC